MRDDVLKRPRGIEKAALIAAAKAANQEHANICKNSGSTATLGVYPAVIDAANSAYRSAGGRRELVVAGRGNSTHPVISIECFIKK